MLRMNLKSFVNNIGLKGAVALTIFIAGAWLFFFAIGVILMKASDSISQVW